MRIVHGDSSNPSVISYYRKGAENHRIEIGPEVSALLHCNPLQKVVCGLTALDTLQVTLIDSNAFADSDVSSVLIHGNVARVGFDAFRRCHRLEHVDCRAWTLEADCFKRCCVLKTVVLGGQLGELPIGAFQFCNALQSITFPDTVHTIGPKAFYHCPSLSHIDLSGSPLAAINEEAFCNCESLKKFVIPRHVAQINGRAFRGCTSLECVEFERWSPCTPAFATVPFSSKPIPLSCIVAGVLVLSTSTKGRFRTVGALSRFVFREAFETSKT